MKKFIIVCLFALVSGLTVTSCTDEIVKPADEGGAGSNPLPKPI